MPDVYLATVALERNRWKPAAQGVTVRASEWIARARSAGFDGLELFQRHYLNVDPAERSALLSEKAFIPIFNGYATFDADGQEMRSAEAEAATQLACRGIKFNLGKAAEALPTYAESYAEWIRQLPQACQPLCECHGGTVIETPESARRFFSAPEVPAPGIITHLLGTPDPGAASALLAWVEAFGSALTHIHVQTRKGLLEAFPEASRKQVRCLLDAGFTGSWSLEFTEGTAKPEENIDAIWDNLQRDLEFLKKCLSDS